LTSSPAGLVRRRDLLLPSLERDPDPPELLARVEPDFFAAATGEGAGPLVFFSAATGESLFSLPAAARGDAPPETGSVPEPLLERPALTARLRGVAREPLGSGADELDWLLLLLRAVFAAATGDILCALPSAAIGDAPPASWSEPLSVDLPASTVRVRGFSEEPLELRDLADARSDSRPDERD
jgi:hypothetical protein